jgi:hypothetical protein
VPVRPGSGHRAGRRCARLNGHSGAGRIRDSAVAGSVAAALSGLPSTVHAFATGADPWAATLAAGSMLLPHETRRGRLIVAATVAHGALSLAWALVLSAALPRRHPLTAGAAAGLGIAALDLGVIGRRLPRIRALPLWPQVADHVAYGMVVATVLARRRCATISVYR